jgi:predicted CXXCH cytochrome family protein
LALLFAGGAIWLLLAAVPVFADGGPHVSAINNGSSGINADSCAGCHRTHTAQGPYLLAAESEEALCLTCHGATGTGATTDVENGIQYTLSSVRGNAVLGALRGGGFLEARIASGDAARLTYMRTATATSQRTKVPVLAAGEAVTSSHLDLAAGVSSTGIAWGNGAISATPDAGAALDISCGSCHNPHGNGNYRILNAIPHGDDAGPFVEPTTGVVVTDAALPPPGDTRNYTVIQAKDGTSTLLASQVVTYGATAGDYFHRTVPWDPQVDDTVVGSSSGLTANDAPNGLASTFNTQINQWCSQCHSRYLAASGAWNTDSGDAIFKYRHTNTSNKPCTTCHVAHGSNADMSGVYSSSAEYPDGTTSPSSRLLKLDNRGTCVACHDPTETVPAGTLYGPAPVPYVP